MSKFIGNMVFKKILGETVANKQGTEDPYFEYVPAGDTAKGKNKRLKKQKKALPEGISAHDAKVLTKVKRRAYRLDSNIKFCGIKFGWSSVIGIIPGFGDAIDFALAWLVYQTCNKVEGGLPSAVKRKMLINIALDFAIGLVPFLGDIADAMFRCNTKNAVVLEKYLTEKYESENNNPRRRTDQLAMRQSRRDEREDHTDSPPDYDERDRRDDRDNREPRRPDRVATNKSKKSGRWLGGGNSRQDRDLERGEEPEYEYRPAQPPRPRP